MNGAIEKWTRRPDSRRWPWLLIWRLLCVVLLGGTATGIAATSHPTVQGHLEVRITDHREAIGDFQRLEIEIPKIGIQSGLRPQPDAWVLYAAPRRTLDLTQLVEGKYAVLLTDDAPVDHYRWIRVDFERVEGILKDGRRPGMTVFDDPVAFSFRIVSRKRTIVTVDLIVVDASDHPGRGYELHIRNVSAETVEPSGSWVPQEDRLASVKPGG